jgi:cobalt-zinc-cadmium efflux system membrane fusion protein
MTIKRISFSLIAFAALAASFYFGRLTEKQKTRKDAPAPEAAEHELQGSSAEPGLVILSPEARGKFEIKIVAAETRSSRQTIEATGSVAANETRIGHVRPLARGRIHDVYVRLGDQVRTGQPLLNYDNVELGESLGEYVSALAEIQKSNSETEVARLSYERARSLVELGAVAKAELLKRESEYRNAIAETESRKARAAQVEEKLHRFGMTDIEIAKIGPNTDGNYHREASHTTLTAPFAGIVTQFNASPGESIDTSDEVMSITDLSVVWVQANVYEKDIRMVHEGSIAEIRIAAHPGRIFQGKITYVGDVLDPNTRTAKVRVEVPNPERLLKLEMFATVEIPTPAARPALMIPSESIHEMDQRTVAFVRKGNGFEKRNIKTGRRIGDWVEIIEGLEQGESVVSEGSFLLKSEAMKDELGGHEDH